MRKRYAAFAVLFFVVSLFAIGCPGHHATDPQEMIVFENRTGINGMDCFIDGGYKGTVNAGFNLNVEGNYEGDRVLRANVGGLVATRVQYISDGLTFYWTVTR